MCDSGTNDKKALYIKETRPDLDDGRSGCYWPYHACSIEDLFDSAETGESVTLELVEMTEEEFSALPDFEGR